MSNLRAEQTSGIIRHQKCIAYMVMRLQTLFSDDADSPSRIKDFRRALRIIQRLNSRALQNSTIPEEETTRCLNLISFANETSYILQKMSKFEPIQTVEEDFLRTATVYFIGEASDIFRGIQQAVDLPYDADEDLSNLIPYLNQNVFPYITLHSRNSSERRAENFLQILRAMRDILERLSDTDEDSGNSSEQRAENLSQSLRAMRVILERFGDTDEINESDGAEDVVSCIICLVNIEDGEEVRSLRCSHSYHSLCIKKWFEVKQECPICRSKIV